jgi:Raf kinase inhibitor-like YbhB/YbcL family protein
MKPIILSMIIGILLLPVFCKAAEEKEGGPAMKITSPEFKDNSLIPTKFTCRGEDINPALFVENIPERTKSLALIIDDPDAPGETWVHWVVFNIPLISLIEENSIPGKEGKNSFGGKHYGGPCPPSGTHRYLFKLYALDTILESDEGITKKDLEKSMEGHLLEKAELTGLYNSLPKHL